MTKDEIMNDRRFRSKCGIFGIDWEKFNIYEDTIILNSPKKGIFVLLDDSYNTMGIIESENEQEIKHLLLKYKELYNHSDKESGLEFAYPFQNFSLKQVNQLASRVSFHHNNVFVNGKLINDENDNKYLCLLAYLKYLDDQIERHFLNTYQMKILEFQYPNVYSCIKSLMININNCIMINIKEGKRPFPIDIIEYLGQDPNDIDYYQNILYKIINLLLYNQGFKIKSGYKYYDKIEKIEKEEIDLSVLANNLLKILEIPCDDITKDDTINLQSWLEEDLTKDEKLQLSRNK